jgi:quinoprotein glucose dehydrogenase
LWRRCVPAEHEQRTQKGDASGAEHKYSCAEPPWGDLVASTPTPATSPGAFRSANTRSSSPKGLSDGRAEPGGGITTAGNLVFIAATIDGIFRAIDARNGKELWREKLEAPRIPFRHTPRQGRQAYIAVPAAAADSSQPDIGRVIAWRAIESQ